MKHIYRYIKKYMEKGGRVYADYASATPVLPEILREFRRALLSFGNPSAFHEEGRAAKELLETARKTVATVLDVEKDEIVFTSGGTEGDAIAILGVLLAYEEKKIKDVTLPVPHMIVSSIEHSAVRETVYHLRDMGRIILSEIPVSVDGLVSPKDLRALILPETILVSVIYVNNEIGVIQPIAEIAKVVTHARKNGNGTYPLFHTDAAQAIYQSLRIPTLHADLLSLNGAKMYAPKGSGALFVRRGIPITSLYDGGSQERSIRPGTPSVAHAHAFARALLFVHTERAQETTRLTALQTLFENGLTALEGVSVVGAGAPRSPHITNITIDGVSGEEMTILLDTQGIAVSSKSACTLDDEDESYVIAALRGGFIASQEKEQGTVRFSFGYETREGDILYILKVIKKIIAKKRETAARFSL